MLELNMKSCIGLLFQALQADVLGTAAHGLGFRV